MKIFKKIFCLGIVLLTLSASISVNASVLTNEGGENRNKLSLKMENNNTDNNEKGEKTQSYLEPIYDDLEDENEIPLTRSADAKEDAYENNDSFTSAKLLSESFSGTSIAKDYSTTINATLHRNEWLWGLWKREIDEDYFKLEIYGKANVSINLTNIPTDCDYDLEFYEFDNVKYCEEDDISFVSQSKRGSNINEEISVDVLPNVYFIRIYSYSGFNAQSPYSLSITVDYTYNDESISDLKYSKNAGAAVWISDFDPFGIQAFSSSSTQEIGYFVSDSYYSAYKIAHPYTNILKSKDEVLHASLFVWNKDIRVLLYETVLQLIANTENEISQNERIRYQWEIGSEVVNGVSIVTSITLTILSVANAPLSVFTVAGLSIAATLAPGCFDAIMETVIPTEKIEIQKDYLVYLRILATALECNEDTGSNEVIRIDSKYRIVSESVPLIVQTNYSIDYTPEVQSSYLYGDDTIGAYQEGAYFNGTVYPIRSLDDLNNARNKNQFILEEVNTGGNTQINLNQSIPESLDEGEYHWYNFTAPENGVYKFYTEGTTDTYGEIFGEIVPGRQTKGRIDYNDDIDYSNGNRNFCIEYPMYKGHTIYIRVHGYMWEKMGLYSLRVEKSSELTMTTETIDKDTLDYRSEYVDSMESTSVILDSGFSFTTNRLRCGIINYNDNSYLALSAKCKGAGVAYLEFNYTRAIQSFGFDMAIWSDDERLNTKSAIMLEVKDENGQWIIYNNFSIADLSKSKDSLDAFGFDFGFDVYGTRIKVTTNTVTSTTNKGRVVIDNITLTY